MNEENWGNNGKGRPGVALVGVTYFLSQTRFCHKFNVGISLENFHNSIIILKKGLRLPDVRHL